MNVILRKWMKMVSRNPLAIHLFFMCLFITLGVFLYFWQGISTQNALAEQMLHRQQVIARAGAISTGGFLNHFGKSVALYAVRNSFVSGDVGKMSGDLQLFKNEWSDSSIEGAAFLNSSGVVMVSSNRTVDPKNPINLSDRDYFKWAKMVGERGEYYIGSPAASTAESLSGGLIVPVVSPVFDKNGDLTGALVAAVSVNDIVADYVDPLKISDDTMVFVVDDNAKFIFSSIPSLTGKTITSIFKDVNFSGKDDVVSLIYKHLPSGNEGKADIVIPDISKDNKLTRYLASYSKLNLNRNKWSFVVVSPANEAFLFSGPFYQDQIISLVYLIIVLVSFSIVGMTSARLRR